MFSGERVLILERRLGESNIVLQLWSYPIIVSIAIPFWVAL